MLRVLPKTVQLLGRVTPYHQINRAISSTPTQLIKNNTTPYKEDRPLDKNKAENNKPKTPPTSKERVEQVLEEAWRIEAARHLFAREGQKNK